MGQKICHYIVKKIASFIPTTKNVEIQKIERMKTIYNKKIFHYIFQKIASKMSKNYL